MVAWGLQNVPEEETAKPLKNQLQKTQNFTSTSF